MKHNPDPGHAYPRRHRASRGFSLASPDTNYTNGGIRGENDARGWLFLKHIEAWRTFNEDPENPFHRKVDLEQIGIMGHSRGGGAVGHAVAFNGLTHYPDDANLTWDFGFPIRAAVAIAPVDGQYRPTNRLVPVENVNYLVFHGSHDGDVSSFSGLRTYKRVDFTDGEPYFKASVYVHRANHGQWNTVWGPHDRGPRSARSLDLRGLLEGEEQRQFALVYVTGFLEATLKGREEYLPLFRDHRVAGGWLPKTMYITQFQESSFRPLATFEEDIDVTSGSEAGVVIRGDSLATWRENTLPLRSRTGTSSGTGQENQAVWIGWNNRIAGKDTTRVGPPSQFALELPPVLPRRWELGEGSTLDLMLTALDQKPRPRKDPEAERDKEEMAGEEEAQREDASPNEEGDGGGPSVFSRIGGFFRGLFSIFSSDSEGDDTEEELPLRLSVQAIDANGNSGKVLLNRYGPVRGPIEVRIQRRDDQTYAGTTEMVLQSYSIPLVDLRTASGGSLDLSRLVEVSLLFDESKAGTVVVDQIGFSNMNPAFLAVSGAI